MRRWTRALAVSVIVLAAGCSSAVDGSGSGAPSSPAVLSPSAPPSSSSSSAPTAEPCPGTVNYCDRFADPDSGWPVVARRNYVAGYSTYGGGSYRMGERTVNAKTQLAPYDITTVSTGFGTRVEADATLGAKAPAASYLGLVCWDHTTAAGTEAGFLFFVTDDAVDVTLLDDSDGQPHTIARNDGADFVAPYPQVTHLAATCVQRAAGGTQEAVLTLAIDGRTVLRTTYADSVKNFDWAAGPGTGLLVGGKDSVVFYDNVEISGL